jgi:hypothetical protein
LKYEKIFEPRPPVHEICSFCKIHMVPVSEWAELHKDQLIGVFDSTLQDDSNGAKSVDLCLPVQKLYQFLEKLTNVKHFLP